MDVYLFKEALHDFLPRDILANTLLNFLELESVCNLMKGLKLISGNHWVLIQTETGLAAIHQGTQLLHGRCSCQSASVASFSCLHTALLECWLPAQQDAPFPFHSSTVSHLQLPLLGEPSRLEYRTLPDLQTGPCWLPKIPIPTRQGMSRNSSPTLEKFSPGDLCNSRTLDTLFSCHYK